MKLRSILGVAALLLTLAGVPWVLTHPQHAPWCLGGLGVVALVGTAAYCQRLGCRLRGVTAQLQHERAERQQAEGELRRSEDLFRNYFDLSLTPLAITSADRHWVRVNGRLCQLLGYARGAAGTDLGRAHPPR